MSDRAEIVVVGGGIAGLSAAYYLSFEHDVMVIERETTLTAHSTGRSAAIYLPGLGGAPFSALSAASLPFFREPPDGLADAPLLSHRGMLTLLAPDAGAVADTSTGNRREAGVEAIDAGDLHDLAPWVAADAVGTALYQHDVDDMDVLSIHQAFVRGARGRGVRIARSRALERARRTDDGFEVDTTDGPVAAQIVVNAAGAWADIVASNCGAQPVGLVPKRRTAVTVSAPGVEHGPIVGDADFSFYAKPEAGEQLLVSPMDQEPVAPQDIRPDEETVARALDRAQHWITPSLRHVRQTWAGLRTFAPDEHPVIGFDPEIDGFFWYAGQGGTGIQSSAGGGESVARLINGDPLPPLATALGLTPEQISPRRFSQSPNLHESETT